MDSVDLHRIDRKLDKIMDMLRFLNKQEREIMATLDEVLSETARQTTIEASMEVLLKSLSDALKASGLDAAKVDAAFTTLKANNDAAAAAIVANTPNA